MKPIFNAVISNPNHPEYGMATIPFPIPDEQYDNILALLDEQGTGDAVSRDCKIEEIYSGYPVLMRMCGGVASLDELDYLAKRLDSFDAGEAAQFQAMAEKLDLHGITDLINLTFCCQQATVITDFSDLEAVGRDHYMNLNGGAASVDELNALDGYETALLLIGGGAGVITPYGVVYDNGMKLSHDYDGHHLPPYLYDPSEIVIQITPVDRPEESEMLYFPCPDSKIDRARQRLGVEDFEDCTATLEMVGSIDEKVLKLFEEDFILSEHLDTLNHLAKCYAYFDKRAKEDFNTIVDYAWPQTPEEVLRIAENIHDFTLVKGIQTPEEYGEYMVKDSGRHEVDFELQNYVDYERYGQDQLEMEDGVFIEAGYLAYLGSDPEIEEIMSRTMQEEQPVFDQQMGGMA